MKKSIILLFITIGLFTRLSAQPLVETDTIKNYRLDEITVKSPKYNSNIFNIPAAATMMPSRLIENYQVRSLPEVSGVIPNFFMPDYGSKLTSPVYIRGIGTRINSPSVGLYLDNIPFFEKSAFNFDFFDLERIEVLRGPQGTLYGRNTMGGLINIFTTEPSSERNTAFRISTGSYAQVNTSLLHNQPITEKLSLLLNFNQLHNGGFYTNAYNGQKVDVMNSYSARMKLLYKPTSALRIQTSLQYETSDQGGYPYALYNKTTQLTDSIRYDHVSSYDRDMLSAGLNVEISLKRYRLRAVTGYQYMKDHQDIDQDFTFKDMYFVDQVQNQHMLAQEINFQSYDDDRYEWLCGLFGFFQSAGKTVDVHYGKVLQAQMKLPGEYIVSKVYDNLNSGAALFHQSTLKFGSLAITGGIRLDFERATLDYQHYQILTGNSVQKEDVQSSLNFLEFLPMIAMKYTLNERVTPYMTIAKGYNAGGFNSTFEREEDRSFQPEQSINYETGLKARFFDSRLFTNMALFYINWKNQQIYQPVPSGQGSMLKNAGKSKSQGLELDIKYIPFPNFEVWGTLGYNDARFVEYKRSATLDYSGNFLPYVPEYTTSLGVNYTLFLKSKVLDRIAVNATYQGFGRHYWHEDNTAFQDPYSLLGSRVTFSKKKFDLTLWGKNLLDSAYNSFYFTALNNSYVQPGKPVSLGISLRASF